MTPGVAPHKTHTRDPPCKPSVALRVKTPACFFPPHPKPCSRPTPHYHPPPNAPPAQCTPRPMHQGDAAHARPDPGGAASAAGRRRQRRTRRPHLAPRSARPRDRGHSLRRRHRHHPRLPHHARPDRGRRTRRHAARHRRRTPRQSQLHPRQHAPGSAQAPPSIPPRADRPAGGEGRRRDLRHLHAGARHRGTRARRPAPPPRRSAPK